MNSSPTRRYIALGVLLVVGIVFMLSFGFIVSDLEADFAAEEVDPATDIQQTAAASGEIIDLNQRVADNPPGVERAIETAVNSGSYAGTDHPGELIFIAEEESAFAVYQGSYYRWNSTANDNTSQVTIRMQPVSPEQVATTIATPYQKATPAIKRVIRQGSGTPVATERPGLYIRDGTYYAVTITNEGSIFASLILAPITFVLQTVGRAYAVVAVGLLFLLRTGKRGLHPVTLRKGLLLAAAVIPAVWILTTLSESGSLDLRYVAEPAAGFCVALGIFAGYTIRRQQKKYLALATVLVALIATIGAGVVSGPFAAAGALLGLLICWIASLPLVPYGYYLSSADSSQYGVRRTL